jgi:flagellar basal-body rod protein FlgF
MDNASYIGISRQEGLLRELSAIANNIANINTNGFRREGVMFAAFMNNLESGSEGISIATANSRFIDLDPGEIRHSGNPLDLAIESDGFFLVETQSGQRLTREGAFTLNAANQLITPNGARVLDESGSAIAIPPDSKDINIAGDGAIYVDGNATGKIGVYTANPASLVREGDNLLSTEDEILPVEEPRVRQYAIEGSNVSPVTELARMIEVQRAYEQSKMLSEDENDRIEQTIKMLGEV